VDAVVDHAHALPRRPVEALDLGLVAPRDRDDVPSRAELEDSLLDRADRPMKGIPLRAIAAHGEQVSAMRALARPVDVLTQAALVALHDVVSPAPHRSARGQREREQAKERGLSEDRKPPYADARDIALPRGAQQIDVVSAGHELAQEPGRGGLNAAEE